MNLPETKGAVVLTGHGGLDKLEYHQDWPTPTPAAGEVLVRVAACGLNNTDINTRSAWYSKSVTEGITNAGGKQGFESAAAVCAGVEFDLRQLVYKDLQLTGATIVPPGTMRRLVILIEQEMLKPLLARSFALQYLGKAQEMFMLKKHVGNIVVEP